MVICPKVSTARDSVAAASAEGSALVLVLTACELLVQPIACSRGMRRSPLARRQAGEDQELFPRLLRRLQVVRHGQAFQPPSAQEGATALLDPLHCLGVHHGDVVGQEFARSSSCSAPTHVPA